MVDIKLLPLLEATAPDRLQDTLMRFFDADVTRVALHQTRLEPPFCYWAVYRAGDDRVTLKSFFSDAHYTSYVQQLETYYADRIGAPRHPAGGLHLHPELNAVIWRFPFDPVMPGLGTCLDGAWVGDAIGLAAPLDARLVEYSPEASALFAYRNGAGQIVAYGKSAPADTCGRIYLAMDRLWRAAGHQASDLRMPRPLAFRPEAGLLLQSRVPGQIVGGYRNRRIFLDLVDAAARSLAVIHTADVPFGPTQDVPDLMRRLEYGLGDLLYTAPLLYATLRRLIERIESRAAATSPSPLVPSHGDFKWDQLLEHRGQFSLIDFEFFCRSESALDLGHFCAFLPPPDPADWAESAAAETLRTRFLHNYARATGTAVDLDRVAVYEAATLASRALTHVAAFEPDWELRASEMLDLAWDRLVNPAGAAASAAWPKAMSTRPRRESIAEGGATRPATRVPQARLRRRAPRRSRDEAA
jgi:hypothetical protein